MNAPAVTAMLMVAMLVAGLFAIGAASARPSSAATSLAATQRGPDPTVAMIEATRGPFATAQVSVPSGHGFGGGMIYYPTDTSLGTWGALAIVPGYSALFANEEAWMGPWLSSFGFVVIGVETNTRTDSDSQRAAELQAALDYLTTQSPVRNQVDPTRLSVLGHSAGGAGAIEEAEQHPSLRALIGLAPGFPGQGLSMATDKVPSLIIGGQADGTVTPSYLANLYGTLPASTQSAFAQIAGADHVYYTHPNNVEMKLIIPWLKLFVDGDNRYQQFLCPALPDPSTISAYQPKCPYTPPGGSTSSSSSSTTTTTTTTSTTPTSTSSSPSGSCSATYQTQNYWPGGFQGLVTVTAGSAPISKWTVKWTLSSGQTITQVWNGTLSTSGSAVSVANVSYNGSLSPGTSTTFGFLANGPTSAPTLSCTGS
ncbi:MAG: lipase [Catenulispora sp.]|nr:lipase [Catenulispora sp.]